jgi:hypothetical protein
MNARFRARRLLGLASIGLSAACGGELVAPPGDGGASPDRAGPAVVHPPPVAVVTGGSSGGPSGGSSGGAPGGSSGSSGSSGGASSGDDGGACGADILAHAPGTALGDCWSCIARGCSSQLKECMADCACDEKIEEALTCSEHGAAAMCFLFAITPGSSDDAVQIAADDCIARTQNSPCPCDLMSPMDD